MRNMNQSRLEGDFRKIAEAMPQLVWTATADGRVDYFNRRWIEYTGITLEDAQDNDGAALAVHPDDYSQMWERWKAALAEGAAFETEYRLRHAADGSYRWFLARAVPIWDDGEIARWIGTATDIDEQKRARDSLSFVVAAGALLTAEHNEQEICDELAAIATQDFADWSFVSMKGDGAYRTAAMSHKEAKLVRYMELFRDKYPTQPGSELARVIETKTPLLVEHVTEAQIERAAIDEEHLHLLQLLKLQSVIIVPLTSPQGNVYGALSLVSAESGHLFDKRDLDVAVAVATRAGMALESARMFQDEKRTSQRLRFLAKASEMLLESSDVDETFHDIAELIVSEIADACFIARIDKDALRAVAVAHRDPGLQSLVESFQGARTLTADAERSLIARLRANRPILRKHVSIESLKARGWPYLAAGIDALRPTSAVVVPLHTRRTTYGAILVYYTDSGRVYSEDDLPALMEVGSRASITLQNAQALERERRIARTLQEASLPALIPQPPGLQFTAVYSSAGDEGDIGGDWYDAIDLDDGSVVVSVGDVTGQGLEAAVIMSKVRHAMGVVPRHERDPAKILDSTGWFLRKRYPNAIVTAFAGIISADRKTMRYANAGHPYPILRRDGELIELKAGGLPLGLRPMAPDEPSREIELRDGDLLVLYTDGLTEWSRASSEGERRLRDVLLTDAVTHSLEPAKLIERACIPARSRDDVAILTVKFGDVPHWSFKAEDARAAENARTQLVQYLRERTHDVALVEAAELVFGELIGNVVRHAPGPVEVELDWNQGRPVLHVMDSGPAFRVPNRLPDELSESGRGLFIVQMVSKELCVDRIAEAGNHVRVALGHP